MNKLLSEYIYKNLHQEAYLWARQSCNYNDEYAKEVMQLVYLKILEGKAKFNQKSNVKTWLFSIIRYTAIDYMKHIITYDLIENIVDRAEEAPYVGKDYKEILAQLPERQHQVLLLVFYHDMRLHQVAKILNISIGSVRTHYERGKKKLRILLTKGKAL